MSLRSRILTTTVAGLAATLAVGVPAMTPASASSGSSGSSDNAARKLNGSVIAPFEVAVRGGWLYWSDGFAGTITRRSPKGVEKTIAHVNGEIAGVALSGRKLAYTASPNGHFTRLVVRRPGHKAQVVNLQRYERTVNPDRNKTYGIISGGSSCARQALRDAQIPVRYKGAVDSHPYQLTALPGGAWAIAEAAGNAILRVNRSGHISTIAVLPRQAHTITHQEASNLGLPDCVAGVKYGFEPVPTDVERDGHGNLWVSLLPGGPEGPALGNRGAIYKITKAGKVVRMARGFAGATNLAVTPGGKVYVAELFGGRVSTISHHHIVTVRSLPRPVSVEVTRHSLVVGQLGDIDEQSGTVNSPGGIYRFPR